MNQSFSPHRLVPSGPLNQKCSQIRIASFRYPAKLRLSAAAVLRWRKHPPGCQLATILKIMCITDTGDQLTGRCGANALQFHQPLFTQRMNSFNSLFLALATTRPVLMRHRAIRSISILFIAVITARVIGSDCEGSLS